MSPDFAPRPGESVEIGEVSDVSGGTPLHDFESMLRESLSKALRVQGLTWSGRDQPDHLVLTVRIVYYEPRNPEFFLGPGVGSISIEADLSDASTGTAVGSLRDRRSVAYGGGGAPGAWRTALDKLANDIAFDLARVIRGR